MQRHERLQAMPYSLCYTLCGVCLLVPTMGVGVDRRIPASRVADPENMLSAEQRVHITDMLESTRVIKCGMDVRLLLATNGSLWEKWASDSLGPTVTDGVVMRFGVWGVPDGEYQYGHYRGDARLIGEDMMEAIDTGLLKAAAAVGTNPRLLYGALRKLCRTLQGAALLASIQYAKEIDTDEATAGMLIVDIDKTYYGEFNEDYRHGYGLLIYANGAIYLGGWKDDKKHGWGSFIFSDGTELFGEWKDDEEYGELKFLDMLYQYEELKGDHVNNRPLEFKFLDRNYQYEELKGAHVNNRSHGSSGHGENSICLAMLVFMSIIIIAKDDWVSIENCLTWFAQVHACVTTSAAMVRNDIYERVCRCMRSAREVKDRGKQMPRELAWTCRVTLAERLAVCEANTVPRNIPECPVCFEQYGEARPARILGCGHTFCETCLVGILAPLSGCDRHHKQLPCPGCRDITKVLRGDATTILRNFDLEALCQ